MCRISTYSEVLEILLSIHTEDTEDGNNSATLFTKNNFYGGAMVELEDLDYMFHGHTEIWHKPAYKKVRKH